MQGGSDSFCTLELSSLPTAIPLIEGLSAAEHIAGKMACWPISSCALRSLERTGSRVQSEQRAREGMAKTSGGVGGCSAGCSGILRDLGRNCTCSAKWTLAWSLSGKERGISLSRSRILLTLGAIMQAEALAAFLRSNENVLAAKLQGDLCVSRWSLTLTTWSSASGLGGSGGKDACRRQVSAAA